MPVVREMSTTDIEPSRRIDLWRQGAQSIGSMQHNFVNASQFEGHAKLAMLERLKFGRISVSAHEAAWTHELIRRTDDSFLRIVFQCRGTVEIEQGEARFRLRPGEWTVLNATRPHSFRTDESIEEVILIVPASLIVPRLFDATRRLAGAHSADGAVSRATFGFATAMLDRTSSGPSTVDDHLEAAGAELVRALLEEQLSSHVGTTCRELRVERIRAYIERNLSDPGLSVQRIGEALGCSKRYIHSLFEGGESVHKLIWGTRLQRCARDLQRRDRSGESITTISLSHGFSCPAHFSRSFKGRFGVSPRDYRGRHLDS